MTKSEKTRNFIIEKTIPIFISKGYEGTSLSDIEGATSLSKGSIYGNFANKEEVILAVLDHILLEVNATIDREVKMNISSAEKILVFGKLFNKCADLIQPAIHNASLDPGDIHTRLRQKAVTALNGWKLQLADIIKNGIESGEFRDDVDAEEAAFTLMALIEGGNMISRLAGKTLCKSVFMKSIGDYIDSMLFSHN
ncbi:TetR/AcrR family transcriptional regulator [Flavihumibacter solisilvae]|uniref:HTH tetR-type domain-containing protein n=1 Tax=Flavihumibacter solisilvae TaxID=1349421 RepID=A0A0C1LI35_9BACT|nr:TetR/AcrR family transcriptional regulator [Flavihumibacter solisilvae]KIC95013.1 hypothetical protein OI18_09025 [Flavihumibacter solisilvae]